MPGRLARRPIILRGALQGAPRGFFVSILYCKDGRRCGAASWDPDTEPAHPTPRSPSPASMDPVSLRKGTTEDTIAFSKGKQRQRWYIHIFFVRGPAKALPHSDFSRGNQRKRWHIRICRKRTSENADTRRRLLYTPGQSQGALQGAL